MSSDLFLLNIFFILSSSIKTYPTKYEIIPLTEEIYINLLNRLGINEKKLSFSVE